MRKEIPPAARIALFVVLAACLIYAVYLAAANILLSGGRLSSLINDGPNETWVGYESASSVWPGRARAKNVLVRDRDDRKFAALSAAAKRPLVTNDNHLLADRDIIGIDALTPRAFLAREGEDT